MKVHSGTTLPEKIEITTIITSTPVYAKKLKKIAADFFTQAFYGFEIYIMRTPCP